MKRYFILIGLLVGAFLIMKVLTTPDINEDTIFVTTENNTTIIASNNDMQTGEPLIYFRPENDDRLGSILFGHQLDGEQYYEGGVNTAGVAWELIRIDSRSISPNANRTYSLQYDDVFVLLTDTAETIEDAERFLNRVDFGITIDFQVLVTDATGNAILVGPNADKDIEYTSIEGTSMIATNINPNFADPSVNNDRYSTVTDRLDSYNNETLLDYHLETLNEVKLNTRLRFTMYSFVADLTNQQISVVYKSQFDDPLTFNMDDMLAIYDQQILLRNLFPDDVVAAGNQADNDFSQAARTIHASAIVFGVLIDASIIALLVHLIRKHNATKLNTELE